MIKRKDKWKNKNNEIVYYRTATAAVVNRQREYCRWKTIYLL